MGLGEIDREGKPSNVVGCSSGVVKGYSKESKAKNVIKEYCTSKARDEQIKNSALVFVFFLKAGWVQVVHPYNPSTLGRPGGQIT